MSGFLATPALINGVLMLMGIGAGNYHAWRARHDC